MGKPWNRKPRRKKTGSNLGPCSHSDCDRKAVGQESCRICEQQVEAGKRDEGDVFRVSFCRFGDHAAWSQRKMEKHLLLKHRGVLPAWMLAKLSGKA